MRKTERPILKPVLGLFQRTTLKKCKKKLLKSSGQLYEDFLTKKNYVHLSVDIVANLNISVSARF